ncbi:putative ethylene-forming enzyme [Lasiosphaeria miniovina]|uniref:Ethylene-forming enzyme n=1 Tax=Lasiosphaeria miniovina TaxID=1954250 RepID=A0AA40AU81_9PEZI|nr:putative ethylene-forming enzyme [Lasiosphaeria miniovina]KAK0722063.1 putative ethylene-forming enzyme [Lasiosphaeria miniovina]
MQSILPRSIPVLGRQALSGKAMLSTVTHGPGLFGIAMPFGFNAKTAQLTTLKSRERGPPSSIDGCLAKTMPPGFKAQVANLDTFKLPERVTGTAGDVKLGQALVRAWRQDGIVQIAMSDKHMSLWQDAKLASRQFFRKQHSEKAVCVDSQSYAGYIASGEEVTDGIADYSEIFTITRDLDPSDPRVRAKWPCHGPCPWPDVDMKEPMVRYNESLGAEGERLLQLAELGLGVSPGSLTRYTRDGWHHTRVLRFPPRNATNGKGKEGRGIGSHTDYGLLVISAQDDVGGLFVRRPDQRERFANWEKSAAGLKEDDDGWIYIPPVEGVHTVILGDMMQYLTNDFLTATPHKVGLNTRERFALAYFHEPSFQAVLKPLDKVSGGMRLGRSKEQEGIHYGTHFTNMFMRNYPDRVTTKRLIAEDRYCLLSTPEMRTMGAAPAS